MIELFSINDIEREIERLDRIMRRREVYIINSNTPFAGYNTGVSVFSEDELEYYSWLNGELEKEKRVSQKEAKERVKIKREIKRRRLNGTI